MSLQTENAFWIFKRDFENITFIDNLKSLFFSTIPLHTSKGVIIINEKEISLLSETDEWTIQLYSISQIYLGFDNIYKRGYVKNFGLLWQPLRITYNNEIEDIEVYIIIGLNTVTSSNQQWFELLKNKLS